MSGGEEVKTIEMTPDQKAKAMKDAQKRQAMELASYKKRLREGNDLKEQQVNELHLNIQYFELKKKWLDLQPEVEALEAREIAIMQEARRKQEEAREAAEKGEATETPKIVVPKQGKPRAKKADK